MITAQGTVALAASSIFLGIAQVQAVEGVLQWKIHRRNGATLPRNGLDKRESSTASVSIANDVSMGGYFASCEVGTPRQKVTLQLDTGSSDIWLVEMGASVCKSASADGCQLGTFTPSDSSTFDDFGKGEFLIKYADGSKSEGDYFRDVFHIGSTTLNNMTMGLGIQTDIAYGLVGVGYETNEAILQEENTPYANLPVSMLNEGLINTIAYSLWLNDLDASTGNILFGGIDTAKYHGDLTRIEIYPATESGDYTTFLVVMTSLLAVSSSGTDSLTSQFFPIPVVLDSGTTLSYLPTDLAQQVWTEVGAVYSTDYGLAVISCAMARSTGYFIFGLGGLGGPRINVTMSELVIDITDVSITIPSGPNKGTKACEFGIQNLTESTSFLLGDTFLRSAYAVYDLVNNQIALANTEFNVTDSNMVAFTSSGAIIPLATEAPNQAQVTQTTYATTTPAYAAASGFSDGASSASGASAASAVIPPPLGLAQVSLTGLSIAFIGVGSGLFVFL